LFFSLLSLAFASTLFLNPFLSSVLFRLFPFLLFPSLTYFNPSCSSFHFIHFVSFNSFLSSILSNLHAISFSSASFFVYFLPSISFCSVLHLPTCLSVLFSLFSCLSTLFLSTL